MKNPAAASALILFSLFSPPGLTADLATITPAEATQVSIASTELHRSPAAPVIQAPVIQFAAVGEARTLEVGLRDTGALRDTGQVRDVAAAGGLPSTPVALASLLLILCILIGRRNT